MIFLILTEGIGNPLNSIFLIQTWLKVLWLDCCFHFHWNLGSQSEKWCNISGRNARSREFSCFHPLQSNSQIISQRAEVLGTCGQPWQALSHLPIQRFGQHFEKSEKVICFSADIKCNQNMPGKPQEKQLKETTIQWSKIQTDQPCSFPHFH